MLAYFKKYKTFSYLISFGVPIAVIAIVFLVTGINLMSGIAGGVVFLVLMLALMFASSKLFGKKADDEAERMLALYNRNCDPQSFRDQAKEPARAIYEECYTGSTSELGAWFMAPYALACADLGESNDAEMMEKALLNGINDDLPAADRAGVLINVEPLILRLHGPEPALKTALQAQSLLLFGDRWEDDGESEADENASAGEIADTSVCADANGIAGGSEIADAGAIANTDEGSNAKENVDASACAGADVNAGVSASGDTDVITNASRPGAQPQVLDDAARSKLAYLSFEIPLLQAMIAGDAATLLKRFESVVASESNPMRMRVLDADASANLYEAAGDFEAARKALEFVVEHGGGLPVVQPARVALAKLQ